MSSNRAPLILTIETATRAGSLALTRGTKHLSLCTGDPEEPQTQSLLLHIENMLAETGIKLADIDLFAASAGPGSFTGLRTGLATVKSLAATLSRPCVGIPTLHAVACSAGASANTIALIPAGRSEVFAQLFRVASNSNVLEIEAARHVNPQDLFEQMKDIPSLVWAGDGAHLYAREIEACATLHGKTFADAGAQANNAFHFEKNSGWVIAPAVKNLAAVTAQLALLRFLAKGVYGPEKLYAIYVRPSDAELKEQCRAPKTPSK